MQALQVSPLALVVAVLQVVQDLLERGLEFGGQPRLRALGAPAASSWRFDAHRFAGIRRLWAAR